VRGLRSDPELPGASAAVVAVAAQEREVAMKSSSDEKGTDVPEHTAAKLARALSAIPAIPREMVQRAVDGYYHDFLSPLDFPEIQLVQDLRTVAANRSLPRSVRQEIGRMAQRVIDGEFDASPEESAAWAESPEGKETFRQLADDVVFGGMVRDMQRHGKEGQEQ
jgi:hypothetical protein